MKGNGKKRLSGETFDEPSKIQKIEHVIESNRTVASDRLETYLIPSFTDRKIEEVDGSVGYRKVCGIEYSDSDLECERITTPHEFRDLVFQIAGPGWSRKSDVRRHIDNMIISIGSQDICLCLHRQNRDITLRYSIHGRKVSLIADKQYVIVTNQNLNKNIRRIDPQLPSTLSSIVNHFRIERTERLILSYRNRTMHVLRIFCSRLPNQIFSVIWDFAISDGVLSSKFICEIARLLDDVLKDREKHWFKNVSLAVSKIVERLKRSEITYLLESCMLQTEEFKLLGQFAKKIYSSNEKDL